MKGGSCNVWTGPLRRAWDGVAGRIERVEAAVKGLPFLGVADRRAEIRVPRPTAGQGRLRLGLPGHPQHRLRAGGVAVWAPARGRRQLRPLPRAGRLGGCPGPGPVLPEAGCEPALPQSVAPSVPCILPE